MGRWTDLVNGGFIGLSRVLGSLCTCGWFWDGFLLDSRVKVKDCGKVVVLMGLTDTTSLREVE